MNPFCISLLCLEPPNVLCYVCVATHFVGEQDSRLKTCACCKVRCS